MLEEIKIMIEKIRENDYSGDNGEALFNLDLDGVNQVVDAIEEKLSHVANKLDDLRQTTIYAYPEKVLIKINNSKETK